MRKILFICTAMMHKMQRSQTHTQKLNQPPTRKHKKPAQMCEKNTNTCTKSFKKLPSNFAYMFCVQASPSSLFKLRPCNKAYLTNVQGPRIICSTNHPINLSAESIAEK